MTDVTNNLCNDIINYYSDVDRATYCRIGDDAISGIQMSQITINTKNAKNIIIYRFNFTQEFMEHLYQFSKIHQYDDRKSFKESWDIWVQEFSELIDNEIRRLNVLNYVGDILDKMFKSARYYFRKKNTAKKDPIERREYINVPKDLLDAMDVHITKQMQVAAYKPSNGFINFCEQNEDTVKESINELIKNKMNSQDIITKIKKTYKNRYFILINKQRCV
jgi:hypothetical protein